MLKKEMNQLSEKLMHIAVDIDGILTIETEGWGRETYLNRSPNQTEIKKVNKLFDEGHRILLFTARHLEDEEVTKSWLLEHKVKYHELVLDKPHYHIFIDDKTTPNVIGEIGHYFDYNFHNSCWRFKHGFISPDEKHPCFFCGFDIKISTTDCSKCGIMPCPECNRCLCNIPLLTYITLIRIHEKYCCNLPEFDGRIKLGGFVDNDLIYNCEKTLTHCKNLEGI